MKTQVENQNTGALRPEQGGEVCGSEDQGKEKCWKLKLVMS